MYNIYLFGVGEYAKSRIVGIIRNSGNGYRVLGMLDNNPQKSEKDFYGYRIKMPNEIIDAEFDYIILLCNPSNAKNIKNQLVCGYKIDEGKIRDDKFLLKISMLYKYRNCEDEDIQETLNLWKSGAELTSLNQFDPRTSKDVWEVYWDAKVNMPYVFFETIEGKKRKLYYPRSYNYFEVENGVMVAKNLRIEICDNSPHQYMPKRPFGGDICVSDGDVVIDAGVCEGNFALYNVDVASKMYLFESDDNWIEALHYTFKDYENRIVIVDKAVSNRSGNKSVRLDDVVRGKVDFLKMDIEGDEILGLLGAERILEENDVKCSICTYHRHGDEKAVKKILHDKGYKTEMSVGYCIFIYEPDIFYHMDFRRMLCYGKK